MKPSKKKKKKKKRRPVVPPPPVSIGKPLPPRGILGTLKGTR